MTKSANTADETNPFAICVFAKQPVPGQVKTRLIPAIGAEEACRVYRELLGHTLCEVAALTGCYREVCLSPSARDRQFLEVDQTWAMREQRGANLGTRMANSFARLLRRHRSVVLIGSDCPEMTTEYLNQARDVLTEARDARVVVGPSDDGGYVLLGMNVFVPELFASVDWGTSAVLATTRDRLRRAGVSTIELATLFDLDTKDDLQRYHELRRA